MSSSSSRSSDGGCAACGARQSCTGFGDAATCACNADPLCTALGTLCTSNAAYARCAQDENGCFYEASVTPCNGTTPVCLNGGCVTCIPATTQCSGNGVQTCGSDGAWGAALACSASTTCVFGECTGVCGPGQTTCSGTTPQACDASGHWQGGPACSGATPYCSQGSCTVPPSPPPSCQVSAAGTTNCGAASESCCASLGVPGGSYDRTYTNTGGGATGLTDPAMISSFRLDKYDVTVGRFRPFVSAWNGGAGFTPAAGSGKHAHLNGGLGLSDSASPGTYETGWIAADTANLALSDANLACDPAYATWTSAAGNQETLPINCVNWWEAYAFCIWDGGFLPSEAEWEYAAAGGSEQREYPWGTADPGAANQYAIYGCFYPSGTTNCTGASNIAPVGTAAAGAGLFGQLDLAGNVWQWNLDWSAPYAGGADSASLTGESIRVLRGGNFSVYGGTSYLLPPVRNDDSPSDRSYDAGFRCARSP